MRRLKKKNIFFSKQKENYKKGLFESGLYSEKKIENDGKVLLLEEKVILFFTKCYN